MNDQRVVAQAEVKGRHVMEYLHSVSALQRIENLHCSEVLAEIHRYAG